MDKALRGSGRTVSCKTDHRMRAGEKESRVSRNEAVQSKTRRARNIEFEPSICVMSRTEDLGTTFEQKRIHCACEVSVTIPSPVMATFTSLLYRNRGACSVSAKTIGIKGI